jgi:hypothetical protein
MIVTCLKYIQQWFIYRIEFIIDTATTKAVETLFAANFFWFACICFIPKEFIVSSLVEYFDGLGHYYRYGVACLFAAMFIGMSIGLYKNILWLRQTFLIASCAICMLYASILLFATRPIGAAAGFLLILAALALLSAWKSNVEG